MKYQIILSSNEILADDEFEKHINECYATFAPFGKYGLKLVECRSLEGIKEEFWKHREELKEGLVVIQKSYASDLINESFDETLKLFNLD